MTSSALRPKWIVHLALVLMYQTTRLVEGHPYAPEITPNTFVNVSPNAGNPLSQNMSSVSRLIETAYKNHELLGPRQWSQQTDGEEDQRIRQMQQESSSDEMMQYRKRKLLQVSNTDTLRRRHSDEKIIFPDGMISSPSTISPRTMMQMSTCRKSTFCENVADYPRQLVNAAIARNASLRFLEIIDPMPDSRTDVEQRIDVTDVSICQFRERVIYPQTAENKDKQWLYIVNQDELKQGIRIEVCTNTGHECNVIEAPEGYKTTCTQKYIYRELAAVGNDGNIFKDQFRFPSSCCCHIKFTGDPTVRLGLGLNLSANGTI